MGNLFGIRRRAPLITPQDRAILQLKQQRDKIKIYQKKTEIELETNKQLALKLFQDGKKDRALIILRRTKCMDDVLTRTDKQLETLESLVTDIEYTQIEVSVVEGLRVGTEALKDLNSLMSIEDIERMMEDNAEAAEKQREISEILQRSSVRQYEDDELLQELDKLIDKQSPEIEPADKQPAAIVQELPSVPKESPKLPLDLPDTPQEPPESLGGKKEENLEREKVLELAS